MTRLIDPRPTPSPAPAPTAPREAVDHLVHGNYWDPFGVLGSHAVESEGKPARAIRAFLPEAAKAWVVDLAKGEPGVRVPMDRIHPSPGGREPRGALAGTSRTPIGSARS